MILSVVRRLLIVVVISVALPTTACATSSIRRSWPSRATPLSSTLGWFAAINAHDRARLLFYVAPHARNQMGWARPSVAWSRFLDLHCRLSSSHPGHAIVYCTFHETASPLEGNPDMFWSVWLRHTASHGWLIETYGQG